MKRAYSLLLAISCSILLFNKNIKSSVQPSRIKDTRQTKELKSAILNYESNPTLAGINRLIASFNSVKNKPLARTILRTYRIDSSNLNQLRQQELEKQAEQAGQIERQAEQEALLDVNRAIQAGELEEEAEQAIEQAEEEKEAEQAIEQEEEKAEEQESGESLRQSRLSRWAGNTKDVLNDVYNRLSKQLFGEQQATVEQEEEKAEEEQAIEQEVEEQKEQAVEQEAEEEKEQAVEQENKSSVNKKTGELLRERLEQRRKALTKNQVKEEAKELQDTEKREELQVKEEPRQLTEEELEKLDEERKQVNLAKNQVLRDILRSRIGNIQAAQESLESSSGFDMSDV